MSKQPFQQDYSCIDKNPRAAEVLNALLAYARCPAARKNHLIAGSKDMSEKGIAIQALVAAVVTLATDEGVVVTVENRVRAERPITGQFDTHVGTRWARKIYQHYGKLHDPKLVAKTVDELNLELGKRVKLGGEQAWNGERYAEVGFVIGDVEIETEAQLSEYILNVALAYELDLFKEVLPKPAIVDAAPLVHTLGIEDRDIVAPIGDTMMAPVGITWKRDQIDEAAGAPLGVLADLPAAVDACLPALSSLSENERARASLKTMLGFAELIAKIKNGEEVDLSLVPPNALEAITKIMERGGVLYDRLMADSQRHSAAIGKEITENIRAHGSPLPPGDDTAPIAMGHPYAPYPRRNNPHIGSTLDSFLKDEGILESCTEAAKQAIAAGAATPVVMNNDGSLDYYPV
jgi:hypothetical protein